MKLAGGAPTTARGRARVALTPVCGRTWTPQLIELAGGEDRSDCAGKLSRTATWEEVAAAEPGRGRDAVRLRCARAHAEALAYLRELGGLDAEWIVAVNASADSRAPARG